MPKANVRDILRCADENQFAVASINVFNYESALWVARAAELERIPVLIMFFPGLKSAIPLNVVGAIANKVAENASVPIGIHLDHSHTFEGAMEGVPAGFQSIMIDGSSRSFEDNAEITRRVVESASIFGVDVEAELGKVGSGSRKEDFMDNSFFTSPTEAARFIEMTGASSLAVAIGNSHGNYVCEPNLDIGRLDEINKATPVPLVLHGGSGIPAEQVAEAARHGICKMNIATEFWAKCKEVTAREFQGEGSAWDCNMRAGEEVVEFVRGCLRRLNPNQYRLP